MKIHSLHIYPIKSCRGTQVRSLMLETSGPAGDREWMLVDPQGKFLSQRTLGKMAQIETAIDENHLTIAFGGGFFKVSRKVQNIRPKKVQIWDTEVVAHEEPRLYSDAISQFLGVPCTLVKYTSESKRILNSVKPDFIPETRFSDRTPIQILNLKSLADLNSKLEAPVGAGRFRANVIFDGQHAFEEETWKRIKIGSVILSQPKKCARCKIITLDEKTGESVGAEPLKTLGNYRREGAKINFGVLWIPENTGTISDSDSIEILETL